MEHKKNNTSQEHGRRGFIKSTGMAAAGFLLSPQLIQGGKSSTTGYRCCTKYCNG